MKVTYCPYCSNTTYIDDSDWGQPIQCEAPKCERQFPTAHLVKGVAVAMSPPQVKFEPTNSEEPSYYHPVGYIPVPDLPRYNLVSCHPEPDARPAARVSLLTGPFRCHGCAGLIHRPQGRRHATFTHFDLLSPNPCRTDTYAAVYHCPKCFVLLETPHYQWGQNVTCPASSCQETFRAPFDNVLHRIDGDAREGTTFSFDCPSCQRPLLADTLRDGRPTAGLPVACTGCRHIIEIPYLGFPVLTATPGLDAIQSLQLAPLRRCRGCEQNVPANASPCPLCGYPDPEIAVLV